MKWIGTQTIYDNIRLFGNAKNIQIGDGTEVLNLAGDLDLYQPVNNADPKISIGASDDERLVIQTQYEGTTTQSAQVALFATFTESSTANDGRFHFAVDGTQILRIQDDGLDLRNSSGISIDGTDIITDSSGTATLSNIDALDLTTLATIEAAVEANIDSLAGPITLTQGVNGGGSAFKIDNDDVDQKALEIDAIGNTTADVIYVDCNSLTTGGVINLDVDDALTTAATKSLILVDYDKSGTVDAEAIHRTTGLSVNLADAATNHSDATVTSTGVAVIIDAASNQGIISQTGYSATLTDGDTDTTIGYYSNVEDGGVDFKAVSSADTGDYCTINTTTHGATTITTVDDDATAAHFEIAADGDIILDSAGQIKLEPVAGNNILLDGTVTVDGGSVTGITTLGVDSVSLTAVQTASESFADNDTSIMTSAAIRDEVRSSIPNLYGSTIKIIPSDFMTNEEGGSTKFGIGFVDHDNSTYGMKVPNAATELLAFVSIPEGMKATHVDIYDNSHNLAIEVFESDINSSGMTSKGSGNANTTLDITDVNSTATNFLLIQVTTTATSNRVFGGKVTIASI